MKTIYEDLREIKKKNEQVNSFFGHLGIDRWDMRTYIEKMEQPEFQNLFEQEKEQLMVYAQELKKECQKIYEKYEKEKFKNFQLSNIKKINVREIGGPITIWNEKEETEFVETDTCVVITIEFSKEKFHIVLHQYNEKWFSQAITHVNLEGTCHICGKTNEESSDCSTLSFYWKEVLELLRTKSKFRLHFLPIQGKIYDFKTGMDGLGYAYNLEKDFWYKKK